MTTNIYPSSPSNVIILQLYTEDKDSLKKKTKNVTSQQKKWQIGFKQASVRSIHLNGGRQTDTADWLRGPVSFHT